MLSRHRNRSATPTTPSTNIVTSTGRNAGPFTPPSQPSHTGVVLAVGPRGSTGHRPAAGDPTQPACPAYTTNGWAYTTVSRAVAAAATACRERNCFPHGWDR
jgi:hypothetical protein